MIYVGFALLLFGFLTMMSKPNNYGGPAVDKYPHINDNLAGKNLEEDYNDRARRIQSNGGYLKIKLIGFGLFLLGLILVFIFI